MKPENNPYFAWPRISDLAKKYGVSPARDDAWPMIGAYGADGNFYDVRAVIEAVKAGIEADA